MKNPFIGSSQRVRPMKYPSYFIGKTPSLPHPNLATEERDFVPIFSLWPLIGLLYLLHHHHHVVVVVVVLTIFFPIYRYTFDQSLYICVGCQAKEQTCQLPIGRLYCTKFDYIGPHSYTIMRQTVVIMTYATKLNCHQ